MGRIRRIFSTNGGIERKVARTEYICANGRPSTTTEMKKEKWLEIFSRIGFIWRHSEGMEYICKQIGFSILCIWKLGSKTN